MIIKRKETNVIKVGYLKIGGKNPIIVQSMLKNKIDDFEKIQNEIKELEDSGCEIIRIAIPEKKSIFYLKELLSQKAFNVPVVADIHFDYRLALGCLDAGVDCVRINPGNIGSNEKVSEIIKKAREKNKAIRIGVNSGSIEKKFLKKYEGNIIESIVESTLEKVRFFEKLNFYNFKISAKAASVQDTISIYKILSDKIRYPLHLGITEAGPLFSGSIKSAVGLGILLYEGIGDTIRVSLTDKSIFEVRAAYQILSSLDLRKPGINIISCPTCGRTKVNLKEIANEIETGTSKIKNNFKIAIMGCIVNGPGEAKDADIGIAFARETAAIFVKGKVLKRVNKNTAVKEFLNQLNELIKEDKEKEKYIEVF